MNLMQRSSITRPNIDLSRKFTDAGSNSVQGFKRLIKPRTSTCRAYELTGLGE